MEIHCNSYDPSLCFFFLAEIHNLFPIYRLTHDVIPVDIEKECALEQEKCTCVKGTKER